METMGAEASHPPIKSLWKARSPSLQANASQHHRLAKIALKRDGEAVVGRRDVALRRLLSHLATTRQEAREGRFAST
jgi:hypothetical protein